MRLKIAPVRVLRWNRQLSKFRSGERRQKTNTLGDWGRFEEEKRIYKKGDCCRKKG